MIELKELFHAKIISFETIPNTDMIISITVEKVNGDKYKLRRISKLENNTLYSYMDVKKLCKK